MTAVALFIVCVAVILSLAAIHENRKGHFRKAKTTSVVSIGITMVGMLFYIAFLVTGLGNPAW